jgi:penicillin V acylase-like amidase (Ntn superfamily)
MFCFVAVFFVRSDLESCSTFFLQKKSHPFVAKSYDWKFEDGLVVVNKRNVIKKALTSDQQMEWVSKYGSITFVQEGRDFPLGGMNETGLVVELMWLNDTAYPLPDSRKTIGELQWIQYQLDTASTVEEVVASDKILRIDADSKAKIHFLAADSKGHVATVEFIDGRMVAHYGEELITPVLTNDSYQKSVQLLKEYKGFGGSKEASPKSFESIDRFVRIATLLQKFSSNGQFAKISDAFDILANVSNFEKVTGKSTMQWNIVYDIKAKEIQFFTVNYRDVRTIRMNAFDFDGNTDVEVLDMQSKLPGDVSNAFMPYTYERNRKLIDCCCDRISFLKTMPEEYREAIARYPEKMTHYNKR